MAALPQISTGAARVIVSASNVDTITGDVRESPALLLGLARRVAPWLDADTYALARVIASELGDGSLAERAAIADADANRAQAAGRDLAHHVAPRGTFGRQGSGGRVIASSQDPSLAHCELARAIVHGSARGFAHGATVYFDPLVQWNGHKAGKKYLHPAVIVEKWTFNKTANGCTMSGGRYTCTLSAAQAGGQLEWVGEIDGVRAHRLMLFKRATNQQATMYANAQAVVHAVVGGVTLPQVGMLAIVGIGFGAFLLAGNV